MKIIKLCATKRLADQYFDSLLDRFPNGILKYYKLENKILLTNADVIEIHHSNMQSLDGLRADVTLSEELLPATARSKEDKRLWTDDDLFNYLTNITKE